jgi:uncharacterized repeat protein (TIGR01451 family)
MRIGLILCMLCGRRRNSPSNRSGFRALARNRYGLHKRRGISAAIAALVFALAAPAQLLGQTAPSITSGPDDLSVQSGAQAVFQVNASGSSPIAYRWFFNDTNSLSGTGSTLTVSNVSLFNAGGYSVIASNASGTATSRVARLAVDEHLTFRVLALRTNGFIAIEHSGLSGDDRGAIAVSSNSVLYTGDNGTARWNIETLAGGIDIGRSAESLVTDLRTETLYSLGNGNSEIFSGGMITSLIELTPTGGLTGRRIDLSRPIPTTADFPQVGIFAGMGRAVIHNRTNAFSIAIPSGVVTDLGPTQLPFAPTSESWAFWGVAEYFNDAVHLLYVNWGTFPVRNIIRLSLPSGNITTVATFTNLSDMAVLTISPSLSRWFFHYEGNGQFRNGQETLGSAKALFTTDPGFPSILRDPQSQTNYPGGTATFLVEARGAALVYQWFFNGSPIAGATEPTLVLDNITPQNAGIYTVQVSNDRGSAMSGIATLTVFTTPIVRAGPFSRAVYAGQSTAFFALVDGAPPLSYQWRFNGSPIAGGTNAILLLTNIQPSAAGLYSLRVTNIYGAAVSTNATLTVITSPFITAQPPSLAEFVGSNLTLVVTADGAPPLYYQWRFGNVPIPNATNRTLLLTNVQVADSGDYSVVITNQYGSVTSSNATVTVLSELDDQGIFQITSLLTTGARIVDHNELAGDDRGGIGITRDHVFITGDNGTARFNAGDLAGGLRITGPLIENLVTDLRTETVYRFADGTNLITFGTVTSLVEMNASGGLTGQRINLSRPIPLNFFDTGIFAGYGRILIFNGERVFHIFMPSGLVRDLGPMSPFPHQGSETWAFWGVAEHVRGTNYLVYCEDPQRIVRRRVPDGEVSVVGNFTALNDMASFVVSPSRRRWYFHYEGSGQFGGNLQETVGCADATFNIRSGTGLDHFEWSPIGPVQVVNVPFPARLTALNQSNQAVTNFSGPVLLSGLNVAGETPVVISPTVITNFINGVWTGMVTARQASAAMFLRADDQVGVRTDSAVFSVSVTNDLVVAAVDSPDPVIVGATLTYSILVTNIGPSAATGVMLTNTLATNLVYVGVTSTQGGCVNEGRIVRCDLGTIPGGTGATIQVQTVPSASGPTTSHVSVRRGEADANLANNLISIATLVTLPAVTIADLTVTEGDSGTNDVTFSLTLTPASTNTVRVNFSTANGTAIGSGSTADYVPRSGTVTFAPGTTNQQITVGVRGDRIFENDEAFLVNLTAPVNGMIEDGQAAATVLNDDAMPTVTVTDATVTEQNTTTTNAIFRVSLSSGSGLPVVVTFAAASGTAEAGIDFSNRVGQLTFTAGTPFLTQNVAIIVFGDTTPEVNETFFLHLTSATNATIARASGIGTIINDDGIGQMHHFEWAAIASPQAPNTPFPVAITARDVGGLLITNFNSVAHLTALVPNPQPSNSILGNVTHENTFTGDYTLGNSFTPAVEMRVTHVRHYFGNKVSIWADDGTLLVSTPVVSAPGTWVVTPLSNEVVLQPGNRYRIAAYTGGGPADSYFWYTAGSNSFPHGTLHESYDSAGDSFPINADGVRWWLVDMLYTAIGVTTAPYVTPTTVGPFVNGAWSGSLMVTQAHAGIRLQANDDAAHVGISEAFDVASTAHFARIQFSGGQVRLRMRGALGSTYRIERADNLGNPNWQTAFQFRFDTSGEIEVIDTPPAGNVTRFYRALLLP